jgi:hypothetical protein
MRDGKNSFNVFRTSGGMYSSRRANKIFEAELIVNARA